jgi:prolipoprotein diacylglyceryltransferase
MFLYAVSRYIIEIYRGDPRGVVPFLDISTSQFISLVLGPLSLIMLVWLSRTLPTAPQESRHRRRAAA